MNVETIVTIVAAATAGVALYFNLHSTRAARKAAQAAEKQTEIQQQIQMDAAQPYVWIDIRPDDATGTLLNLVLGNSGRTVATNVRITVDRTLPAIDQQRHDIQAAQARLRTGLPSLPPGRTYSWCLGQGFALIGRRPSRFRFQVRCDGPFGVVPEVSYVVDLSTFEGMLDRPAGSTYELTRAVVDLTKQINKS